MAIQTFVVGNIFFERCILCSPGLHLFNKKNLEKNSDIGKYYYNLK